MRIDFSSLLTKLAASKQEAKKSGGGQNNSDTFKLYINPANVGNSTTSALQVRRKKIGSYFINLILNFSYRKSNKNFRNLRI